MLLCLGLENKCEYVMIRLKRYLRNENMSWCYYDVYVYLCLSLTIGLCKQVNSIEFSIGEDSKFFIIYNI